MKEGNGKGIIASLDWWTIGIYLALLAFGWLSVCGASYSFDDADIFDISSRSGMQIVWIATSICLGFVILMMDDRGFDTFAFIVYGAMLLLLFATIFNPRNIKGSHSWLVLGLFDCNLPNSRNLPQHLRSRNSCQHMALT